MGRELDKKNMLRREKGGELVNFLDHNISIQRILPHATSVYYFFVIKMDLPFKEARRQLMSRGIDVSTGSEITDDCSSVLNNCHCPQTEKVYEHAIQLPLYEGLTIRHIKYIAESVNIISKNKNYL